MPKFGFVICSHNEKRANNTKRWIAKFFPADTQVHIVHDTESIFRAYNKGIELTRECVYVCFCHEDIEIEYMDIKTLESMFKLDCTGFIGVAGAKKLPDNGMWWTGYDGTNNHHPNLSGQAGHVKREPTHGYALAKWYNTYGTFGQVEVLDGVILFCKRELLNVIQWDEKYFTGWDFYDITITWKVNQLGYKNFTYPNIKLYHEGLGNLRDTYEVNRLKFLEWIKA